MKRLLSIVLLVLAAMANADAQLLYRISGKDLKKPSYVFGTFHIANTPFVEKVAGIRQALDETDQVYGEVKWDDVTNPDSLRAVQARMALPAGKTLKTVLNAGQYKKLDKIVTAYMGVGLSNPMVAQQMEKLSPAALLTQLTMLQYMTAHMGEFDPTNTIDQYFQLQAKNNNEKIGGLETLSFQLGVLFGAPLERQVVQLDCFLGNPDYYAQLTERMAKAYYAQDINALADIMNEKYTATCDATPEENNTLIYNRNAAWAAKMPSVMSAAPTLFVVGAGHLPGERGVLRLLERHGYRVEPVK